MSNRRALMRSAKIVFADTSVSLFLFFFYFLFGC